MSVANVSTVTPWNANGATSTNSGSFTPTAGNCLVVVGGAGVGTPATLSFGGSVNTPVQLTPPGNYYDVDSDVWGVAAKTGISGSSQTLQVGCSASAQLVAWAWEYSGVGSVGSVSGVQRNSPGTGAGAITGTAVTVPTGAILLAFCTDTNGTGGISAAGGGTSRGAGTNGLAYFGTAEYAGSGSSVTPSFTTTVGADNYAVLQILLSPPSSGGSFLARKASSGGLVTMSGGLRS